MESRSGRSGCGGAAELLAVRILVERRSLRVVLAGELDLGEVETLQRDILRALVTWPCPSDVRLDLGHLRFIDVTGLRALAEACRILNRSSTTFSVVGTPRHVRRAIAVTGVQVPGVEAEPPSRMTCQEQTGVDMAGSGLAKRKRTAVPLRPDRSSTRSHS